MKQSPSKIKLCLIGMALSVCIVDSSAAYPQAKSTAASKAQEPSSEPTFKKALTPRQIVDKVLPSVVLIVAQDENGEPVGQGSGFFYKPGLVATNLHVFTRASQAYVKVLNGGITYKVIEVVGIDMRRDLCVVRVDDNSTPPLTLNRSNEPSVGDEVLVVSNPKGLEGSVSKGIVSSVRKDAGLIQIDAAISPGSSGGAVVNDRAEVIGIAVSSVVGGQNLNFAVRAEYLSSLKLNFKVPVIVAGAFSLKDRDKDKLKGLVQSVTVTRSFFGYDQRTSRYFEEPAETVEKSVYDVDGNKVEFHFYLDGGKFLMRHIYSYDGNGFKTRLIEESASGTRREYEVTLDESISEKIRDKQFSGSTETPIGKQVYNREGNEIELTLKLIAGLERRVFAYGRHGFVAEEKIYLNDKLQSITRSTYETDENGNWVKRVETGYYTKYPEPGFAPSAVTYREIRYFGQ